MSSTGHTASANTGAIASNTKGCITCSSTNLCGAPSVRHPSTLGLQLDADADAQGRLSTTTSTPCASSPKSLLSAHSSSVDVSSAVHWLTSTIFLALGTPSRRTLAAKCIMAALIALTTSTECACACGVPHVNCSMAATDADCSSVAECSPMSVEVAVGEFASPYVR